MPSRKPSTSASGSAAQRAPSAQRLLGVSGPQKQAAIPSPATAWEMTVGMGSSWTQYRVRPSWLRRVLAGGLHPEALRRGGSAMETRKIGSLNVSIVGLGCNNFGWRLDYDRTVAVVDAALEAGINFLDTADIYGGTESEEFLGRALAGRRDKVVLATKFGMKVDEQRQGAKPDYARRACEDSLRRLRTDHIDLYQLHQPDPSTPIRDTLAALDGLVRAGKVREIGCSNFSVQQLREAKAAAGTGAKFVSVQNEYSLLHREPEQEVLPECEREGLAFLPFFPLARGMLTCKYWRGTATPSGN